MVNKMIKKSMLDVLSKRIEDLKNKLNNATTDKEKLIYKELIEQSYEDIKRVHARTVKKTIYRTLGTLMLLIIIIQGVLLVHGYLKLQEHKKSYNNDDLIGNALIKRNNDLN